MNDVEAEWEQWAAHGGGPPPGWNDECPDSFSPDTDADMPASSCLERAFRERWATWAKGQVRYDIPVLSIPVLSLETWVFVAPILDHGNAAEYVIWELLQRLSRKRGETPQAPRRRPAWQRRLPQWVIDHIIEVASRTLPIHVLVQIRRAARPRIVGAVPSHGFEVLPAAPSFAARAVTYAHHASTR